MNLWRVFETIRDFSSKSNQARHRDATFSYVTFGATAEEAIARARAAHDGGLNAEWTAQPEGDTVSCGLQSKPLPRKA